MKAEQLDALRHSAAHLLAAAVLKLWPNTKRAIGPAISDGFYYDFEFMQPITEEDLKKIENVMRQIAPTWKTFEKKEVSKEEAQKIFADNPYKLELIDEFSSTGQKLTIYTSGEYTDLCRGGHEDKPSENLKNFKLLKIAGAYWRGNEKNKMLTRIYGTAFYSKDELDAHLKQLEEAKLRDHKKLGKELDLFFFDDEVGKGLPIWTPKGTIIKLEIEKFTRELESKYDYQHVSTPYLGSEKLYETSGHLSHYKSNMYNPIDMDGELFYLRPMACPHHIKIFAHLPRSYKELPVRYAEIADYNRFEKSGELMGLIRVRKFQLTDAHIFVNPDELKSEFKNVCKLIDEAMTTLGIAKKVTYRFSKHDPDDKEKYYPDPDLWEKSERTMKEALTEIKLKHYEADGEAAFYGPKLDVQIKNVNGKEDTIITAQMDFLLPEKFGISFIDKDGKEKRPVMIHRSALGCIERTVAYLIEHYGGRFPLWLSPVQVRVVTITERSNDYAQAFVDELKEKGIRAELDISAESMGKKVRNAETEKIPLIVTIGDKEMENKTLAIRYQGKNIFGYDTKKFISAVTNAIKKRKEEIKIESPSSSTDSTE